MNKPSIPKGTRDFSPSVMVRRNYIFDTIKSCFKKYGFLPIETPAMEKLSTLTGKYGDEGDQLMFKILPRGEKLIQRVHSLIGTKVIEGQVVPSKEINTLNPALVGRMADEALRYDLTIPFARYVVQHRNDITFPFKRYQIQPVWRADRPQKGRYREFYQCDADVVGSDSLLNEVDLLLLIDEVFNQLGVQVQILVNNRKVLKGLAELFEVGDRFLEIVTIIDKKDKIGDRIYIELVENGFGETVVSNIRQFFNQVDLAPLGKGKIEKIKEIFSEKNIETGLKGIAEIEEIFNMCANFIPAERAESIEIDMSLARGLNYYTGAIFEVRAKGTDFKPSICGGGRYDDLTGMFGMEEVSGVGISFGADRIYDVLEELDLFPETSSDTTRLLFVNFGSTEAKYCLGLLKKAREANINSELYPSAAKMKKQMSYAHSKGVEYVVMVGSNEMESGKIRIKEMSSGEQSNLTIDELINQIK